MDPLSILVFFVILSVLVLVHEFGHFIMAKKNDVLVEEFGLGLPPRVFGIKIGETLYSLNLLPFGGFVKVFGEERSELKNKKISDKLKKRTFVSKTHLQKLSIIIAGVFFNFLLGFVIMSYLFTQGVPVPTKDIIIEKVIANSPAYESGLKAGDVIKSFVVEGENIDLYNVDSLVKTSKKYAGMTFVAIVQRGEIPLEVVLTPRANPPSGQGPLGILVTSYKIIKYPWYQAPFYGLLETVNITYAIVHSLFFTLAKFLTFQKVAVDVAGPVGIAKITQSAVKTSLQAVLQLVGLLSLNLAVVNILPFPALDGGRMMMVFYEMISKRKVNPQIERRLNVIGFAALLLLIILITINDIVKIFIK